MGPLIVRVTRSPSEEARNEVERIMAQAKNIQDACEHDFRLEEELNLLESLVKGVYVGMVHGPVHVEKAREKTTFEFTLVCLKCSKKKETTIQTTCPICLKKMKEGELESARVKYFGVEQGYYAMRHYRCFSCGFHVVSDEFDQ